MKLGMDCIMSEATADKLGVIGHHRTIIARPEVQQRIGDWIILPFSAKHDVPCLGFVIGIGDERLLYLTDSAYAEHRFSGLTHIMCEANFIDDILTENVLNGSLHPALAHRLRRTHMSLDTFIKMLKANDLSHVVEIVILHLSASNSHQQRMIKEIQEAVGIPCSAAG